MGNETGHGNNPAVPVGQPFSRVYLQRGKPTADSQRLRQRLVTVATDRLNEEGADTLIAALESELGVSYRRLGGYAGSITYLCSFFKQAEVSDILSSCTYVYLCLRKTLKGNSATFWRDFVERCFREENVHYCVDELCGVHFLVDEEFEALRVSTLAALSTRDTPQPASTSATA